MSTIITKPTHRAGPGGSQSSLLFSFVLTTLPAVRKRLKHWQTAAGHCSDLQLRHQALASLDKKAFHCQGGAVFTVPYPEKEQILLQLIIAYQTICDYLDNLCDRAGCTDGAAFYELHTALLDALTPGMPIYRDYYRSYPVKDDGGYLSRLVNDCRACLPQLPSYNLVRGEISTLVEWYIHLQVNKHLDVEIREEHLKSWVKVHLTEYPDLLWQEFAAAAGSTLAIFALMGLASCRNLGISVVKQTIEAYFPWICGLHILLDYFIDQEEDRANGDLNFTFYYTDREEMLQRMLLFTREAHHCAELMNTIDRTVVEGLLAMYLSDKKVKKQKFNRYTGALIQACGGNCSQVLRLCSMVRMFW